MAKEVISISALKYKRFIRKRKQITGWDNSDMTDQKVVPINWAKFGTANAGIILGFANRMLKKRVVHRIKESLTSKPQICNVKIQCQRGISSKN